MTMTDWSIRSEGLSKKFGLSLQQSMAHGTRDMWRALLGRKPDPAALRPGEFWAVRDVSFELKRGQSLGIMGVNGSGKTTLLRILNGTFRPDKGKVTLRGRVGSLIAAGAGFSPMLSGRENIFVNGALLGLSHQEIAAKLDEIIYFSDLGPFIDMPVRHYSSGMFVRLGFAIAATAEPDILLVDEILAVGDIAFQKKCYDYLHRLKSRGTSLILVSHSIGAIWAVCDVGIFMHKGSATELSSVEDMIRAYESINNQADEGASLIGGAASDNEVSATTISQGGSASSAEEADTSLARSYGHRRGGDGSAEVDSVRVLDLEGRPCRSLSFRQGFILECDVILNRSLNNVIVRYTIDARQYKYICVLDNIEQGTSLPQLPAGRFRVRYTIARPNLRPGAYAINMAIVEKDAAVHLFYWFASARFRIDPPTDTFLYADENAIVHLDAKVSCVVMDTSGAEPVRLEAD